MSVVSVSSLAAVRAVPAVTTESVVVRCDCGRVEDAYAVYDADALLVAGHDIELDGQQDALCSGCLAYAYHTA